MINKTVTVTVFLEHLFLAKFGTFKDRCQRKNGYKYQHHKEIELKMMYNDKIHLNYKRAKF